MFAQVGHNELLAAKFVGPFHAGGQDRMCLSGVAADDDDEAGVFYVPDGAGIATVTDGAEQTHRRRRLAITGTIVHIVRADDGSGQLLHKIAFLVRAFGRGDESERVWPAAGFDFRQSSRNLPPSRISGLVNRSELFTKSQPNFPLMQVEMPLVGPSSGSIFRICRSLVQTSKLQPTPQ